MKKYTGYVLCCGFYCGGPPYTREKNWCAGVDHQCRERRGKSDMCCEEKKTIRTVLRARYFHAADSDIPENHG